MAFSRITVDPNKMGGEPCIRGFRLPVATIVEALRYAAEASRVRLLTIQSRIDVAALSGQ